MAMIADAFVSELCEMLLTSAIEETAKILGVPDEIKKLHRRLELMLGVLADAENRRFENQAIDRWLNQLRDLVYDADDIIDECWIEGEMLLSSNSSSSRCVESVRYCCYPPIAFLHKVRFRCKIGKRIRDLNLKLDELAKDETFLHLSRTPLDAHHTSTISRMTSPIVEPEVVGEKIENDTRTLVDLLIKEHKKKFPIFAIVGMGGIGKTTLAQKIYNDEKHRDNFHQMRRIWLCVSQDFSESDLLRSIIKQAGGDPGEDKEKEVLEPMLSQVITNKKYFLVLDDVWDARVWDELLRKPLLTSALITTRNINIAKQMRAIYSHMVEKLSREDGWSLICKMVFEEELKSLSQLRNISIHNLERVSNRAEARAASLKDKPYLVKLDMYCTLPSSSSDVQQPRTNDYEDEEIKRIGEVFEELCPPPCLEKLNIKGYFGNEFPSWMMTPSLSSLRNLRRVVLENCALCQKLPALGMLPQLDFLWIKSASAVTSIGREFLLLGSCFSPYFPKLETLGFEDMPNWEDWRWRWEEDNQTTSLLPSLKELAIARCPKLRSLPESLLCHATALKRACSVAEGCLTGL